MSESGLIPERQLLFSPLLAATIGLEEAVLLQHLQLVFDHQKPQLRKGFAWYCVQRDFLLRTLPFWQTEDLHRVSRSLADKGVLLLDSPPLLDAEQLVFAVNAPARASATHPQEQPAPAPTIPTRRSASLLPSHWTPSEDLLQLLDLNHKIPRQFALDQLEDFIYYWRERGETSHAWENKFRQHVTTHWRRRQQQEGQGFQAPQAMALDNNWRPSADAMEIMARSGIDQSFIEQAIPEFILYWRERGAAPRELNSKFIQHIRIQWTRYCSSLEHSTEPRRIKDNWQPSQDVFDILKMSHIDEAFARSLLPEFIVYWKESNQTQTSWNSKFLQHVKYHWAKSHQIAQTEQANAGYQGPGGTGRTRDRSLKDDLTDTSWAE